jgi:NDP-sugar pyrophosphorylase family protein
MSESVPVLILAGGIGSRLRAVVSDVPKPLASVAGKPFLQWHLEFLRKQGIREIVISTGYKAEAFAPFLSTMRDEALTIECVNESTPLGTGGAIVHALANSEILRAAKRFFVMNGDSFVAWNPIALLRALGKNDGALLGVEVEDASRYGTLTLSQDDRLIGFAEKTGLVERGCINAGVYLFGRELFNSIPQGRKSIETDFFPSWLAEQKSFFVIKSTAPFIDIGTPESYQIAQTFFTTQL